MSESARVRTKKMLLVAAVGVGTVSYVACSDNSTSGNLVGPPVDGSVSGADAFISSGNLAPPPVDASSSGADAFISSGNLVGPLPDAGSPAPDSSLPQDSSTDSPGAAHDSSSGANDAAFDRFIGSGNLVAPLPDAGVD
jgi:hypothetical protein